MGLLNTVRSLLNKFIKSPLPTSNLTRMYSRVCYHLPDLEEEIAFIVAAKLYMQDYLTANKIKLVDIVLAHKLGTAGFCGISLNQMKRHDQALHQDRTSKLIRWVMQMEYLILMARLQLASPTVITDLLIQSKATIKRDIEAMLNDDQAKNTVSQRYSQLIQGFKNSPTYPNELEKIKYAIDQVQSDSDRNRDER